MIKLKGVNIEATGAVQLHDDREPTKHVAIIVDAFGRGKAYRVEAFMKPENAVKLACEIMGEAATAAGVEKPVELLRMVAKATGRSDAGMGEIMQVVRDAIAGIDKVNSEGGLLQ